MNFVFISPHFPPNYYLFCQALYNRGVNVLGLGDVPYDQLSPELKANLTEYHQVENLENYDEVVRAVGLYTYKYGKIDRLNSHNEHWLEIEAYLRTDFNIDGMKSDILPYIKNKSDMKKKFQLAKVNVVEGAMVEVWEQGKAFLDKVGYPVVAKPDKGVGASGTYKIENENDLRIFFDIKDPGIYFFEEFIEGQIYTFDGLADYEGNPVFYASHTYSDGIMEVVNHDLHLSYYSLRDIPDDLVEAGYKLLRAYDVKAQFFHFEFFRRHRDQKLITLEVNMRPPGGKTMDMFNFANNIDLYEEWANVLVSNEFKSQYSRPFHCCYIGRKHRYHYTHSHEEVMQCYGHLMRYDGEVPSVFSQAMGQYCYIFSTPHLNEVQEVLDFTLQT